jgi:hypothetical protein
MDLFVQISKELELQVEIALGLPLCAHFPHEEGELCGEDHAANTRQ